MTLFFNNMPTKKILIMFNLVVLNQKSYLKLINANQGLNIGSLLKKAAATLAYT